MVHPIVRSTYSPNVRQCIKEDDVFKSDMRDVVAGVTLARTWESGQTRNKKCKKAEASSQRNSEFTRNCLFIENSKTSNYYYDSIAYYTMLHHTILYYTIQYYPILQYTTIYYTILYYTILFYTTLYYTILYHNISYYSIQYSIIKYSTVLYYHYTYLQMEHKRSHQLPTANAQERTQHTHYQGQKW